jgi:hypothetical protein
VYCYPQKGNYRNCKAIIDQQQGEAQATDKRGYGRYRYDCDLYDTECVYGSYLVRLSVRFWSVCQYVYGTIEGRNSEGMDGT